MLGTDSADVNDSICIGSYPKVYAIGHRAISELFAGPVLVEEKVDGSQFSFGLVNGELLARTRGKQLTLDAPESLFVAAVETVRGLAPDLHPGWIYRGEYLSKAKHNVLAYDRIPRKGFALFDINTGPECYLTPEEKRAEAERLELEAVPVLYQGEIPSAEQMMELLERESFLGGQRVEGVVVKNYARFCADGKAMMGKYVSERFKEVHRKDWATRNPVGKDICTALRETYRSEARWEKAIQHLRERGELTGTPKDIGALIKEAQRDVREECADEIAAALVKWAMPNILRGVTYGLPEWYKERLLAGAFGGDK